MATLAEVLAAVRVRQGSPSTSDVPDSWLTEGVTGTLRDYALRRGHLRLHTIPGVQDQDLYDLPGVAVRVVDAFWNLAGEVDPNPFDAEQLLFTTQLDPGLGINLFENPSVLNIFYQKVNAFRNRFQGVWQEVIAPTGGTLQVRLMPPVKTTGSTVYVLFREAVADVNRLPAGELEVFLEGIMGAVYETRAARATVVESMSFGGASLQFGGKSFAELSKHHKKRFQLLAGEPAGPTH